MSTDAPPPTARFSTKCAGALPDDHGSKKSARGVRLRTAILTPEAHNNPREGQSTNYRPFRPKINELAVIQNLGWSLVGCFYSVAVQGVLPGSLSIATHFVVVLLRVNISTEISAAVTGIMYTAERPPQYHPPPTSASKTLVLSHTLRNIHSMDLYSTRSASFCREDFCVLWSDEGFSSSVLFSCSGTVQPLRRRTSLCPRPCERL